jgi:outer membrane protein
VLGQSILQAGRQRKAARRPVGPGGNAPHPARIARLLYSRHGVIVMNKRSILALVLALPLSLALPETAGATDIGYVDMQQVIEKSKLGSRVQAELRKDFEPKAKPLGEEEQAIRQLQAALAKEAALMSKDQVAKKETEIKKRIQAYEQTAGTFQQELMKAQQEKGKEVMGPAQKAVDAVAKEKKLSVVLERSMAGIVYLDKGLDITADVVKQMDAGVK